MNWTFFQRLETITRTLGRRRTAAAAFASAAFFLLLNLALALLEQASPFQESLALTALIVPAGLLLLFLILGLPYFWFSRPRPSDLAHRFELQDNSWMDSLHMAIELARRDPQSLNPLEQSLMREVEAKARKAAWEQTLRPLYARPQAILAAILLLVTGFFEFTHTRLFQKAANHLNVRLGLLEPGIEVSADHWKVAKGGQTSIRARFLRWESEGLIVLEDEPGQPAYPMTHQDDGSLLFTLYDVRQNQRFHIRSASLKSPTYVLGTYDPPRLGPSRILIQPPAYTGLSAIQLDALTDLEIPENSSLTLAAATNARQTELRLENEKIPLQPQPWPEALDNPEPAPENLEWVIATFTPTRSTPFRLHLRNGPGETSQSARYQLNIIPDQPPLAEILIPGEDVSRKPEESLTLRVFASDDYGLSQLELVLRVSGEQQIVKSLPSRGEGFGQEYGMDITLEMPALEVFEGDIISYFLRAVDNREPEPQASRSDIFFIEIRGEPPTMEVPGGAPMEQEEINLRAFIIDLKNLIRESYEAAESEAPQRAVEGRRLASASASLRQDFRALGDNLLPRIPPPLDVLLATDWDEAVEALSNAETLLSRDFIAESILPLEKAFSRMVAIEDQLTVRMISQNPQGSGQSGESENPPDSAEPSDSQQNSSPLASALQRLEAQRAEISRLREAQSTLNERIEQAQRAKATRQTLQDLAGTQQDLQRQTQTLARRMRRGDDPAATGAAVSRAAANMDNAASELKADSPQRALPQGWRAHEALLEAEARLEDALDEAAAQTVAALQRAANNMAASQSGMASQSSQRAGDPSSASPDQRAEARSDQENLRSSFEELLQALRQTASDLPESYRETARALDNSHSQARRAGTSDEMTRAAQALHYGRFERAAPAQQRAAEQLEQTAQSLQEALDQLPGLTQARLERLLAAIEADRRRLPSMAQNAESGQPSDAQSGQNPSAPGENPGDSGSPSDSASGNSDSDSASANAGENLQRLQSLWESRLRQTAAATGDAGLAQLAARLQESSASAAPLESAQFLDQSLRQAFQILSQYWSSQRELQRIQLNRETAPPPESYRRQVERYFRDLAEEAP